MVIEVFMRIAMVRIQSGDGVVMLGGLTGGVMGGVMGVRGVRRGSRGWRGR